MAVSNSLAKKQDEIIVKYDVSGQEVKLSFPITRKYLVSGGGNVTDEEVLMFLKLCQYQRLNPFLREAYLIKYGNAAATMVVGKDVFTKRANRNERYAGNRAGIYVQNEKGEVVERAGSFKLPQEIIVGGWAKVYIKGFEQPIESAVSFDEYCLMKDGKPASNWATKPATMIRKVALVQALREAFPEEFQGLYSAEERGVDEQIVSAEPIQQPEIVVEAEPEAKDDPLA